MRRLLLLNTDLERGGTPTVVRELAVRLRSGGVDVAVACLGRWGPVADELRAAGVPVAALDARGPADVGVFGRVVRHVSDVRPSTVMSFLVHANAAAAVASLRVPGVRWVQSIQTAQPTPRWHWPVQRVAARRAAAVVVPSASVAAVATAWAGVPVDRVVTIPNAIDGADWVGHTSPVPAGDPRPYPVAFLGRLDPIKDVPTLVAAVDLLGDLVHLHVWGDGPDRPRVEAEVARRKLDRRVTLHGAFARPQAALAAAGLLVLPSLAEGFGLVLIEAMAAGVPVVATDVAGVRDVVRHGGTGLLVPPGDPAAMAAAIGRVVEDRALRDRLVTAGLANVRRFAWDAVLPIYRDVLRV